MHSVAFFSHKLSRVERNGNVRNRELLLVKLAPRVWCHWLEGSNNPFQVITDHKNLEYLKTAKAWWALFFILPLRFREYKSRCPIQNLPRVRIPEQPFCPLHAITLSRLKTPYHIIYLLPASMANNTYLYTSETNSSHHVGTY